MAVNPLEAVLDKIAQATLKAKMWNGPGEADTIKREESLRTPLVEAIAIKSLDQNYDTRSLFTQAAKDISEAGEGTGRKIEPAEFDKIVGKAVKTFKEEQLLGRHASSKGASQNLL